VADQARVRLSCHADNVRRFDPVRRVAPHDFNRDGEPSLWTEAQANSERNAVAAVAHVEIQRLS
jgi:hypothetical protein